MIETQSRPIGKSPSNILGFMDEDPRESLSSIVASIGDRAFPTLNPPVPGDLMPNIDNPFYKGAVRIAKGIFEQFERPSGSQPSVNWVIATPQNIMSATKADMLKLRSQEHVRVMMDNTGNENAQLRSMIGLPLTRGQPNKTRDRWDIPLSLLAAESSSGPQGAADAAGDGQPSAWINHTYFPVCYVGGANPWCGLMAVFYSSHQPDERGVGHPPEWATVGNGEGGRVYVDVALLLDLNCQLAVGAAIDTCKPQHGSYLWVTDYSADTGTVDEALRHSYNPSKVSGSSLGHAVAACIMGCPSVMYTGYIRKWPDITGIKTMTTGGGADASGRPQKYIAYSEAIRTDDIIEDVDMLPLKCVFALHTSIPLIIPHKASFSQALDKLLDAEKELKVSALLQFYAPNRDYMISTVQLDQGYDYFGRRTPILLSTTLVESAYVGAMGWYAYCVLYTNTPMEINLQSANTYANWEYRRMASRQIKNAQERAMFAEMPDNEYERAKIQRINLRANESATKSAEAFKDKSNRISKRKNDLIEKVQKSVASGKRSIPQRKPMDDKRRRAMESAKQKRTQNLQKKGAPKRPGGASIKKRVQREERRREVLLNEPDSAAGKREQARLKIPYMQLVEPERLQALRAKPLGSQPSQAAPRSSRIRGREEVGDELRPPDYTMSIIPTAEQRSPSMNQPPGGAGDVINQDER